MKLLFTQIPAEVRRKIIAQFFLNKQRKTEQDKKWKNQS